MIAHYGIYGRVYRAGWIAAMIVFCWLFSYGMQLPTLIGVWGKPRTSSSPNTFSSETTCPLC